MSFANEPVLELRRAPVRESLLGAMRELDARLPLSVPVLIGGERGDSEGLDSTDPGAPSLLVARAGSASEADAGEAVAAAERGFRDWGRRPASERAGALRAAAARLRERRFELAALQVRECAKPWMEADADVCEAIDFLEYYAEAAVGLEAGRELLQVPGERNTMRYAPLGVAAVIAPWNFPLAIPCGMTAAALAAGNAVVLKPAEQSPASAHALVEALHAGGVPADALSLLPGYGEAGAALVSDPRVHLVAFTGSGAVGLEILQAGGGDPGCPAPPEARGVRDGRQELRDRGLGRGPGRGGAGDRGLGLRLCGPEVLGGVPGAGARVDRGHPGRAARGSGVGAARGAGHGLRGRGAAGDRHRVPGAGAPLRGPGGREGEVVARVAPVPEEGCFCPPTLVRGLPEDSAVVREEVFGPLLAVTAVPSVEAACDVVDSLPFALTGGLFSRSPATVERVARRSPVGNLYVNRGTTGAMVGRQPFGGNRRSGSGSKAGGPDYLLQFVEPRVVTENTMRHGLRVD